jgi:dihydroxy-acid dehydratase
MTSKQTGGKKKESLHRNWSRDGNGWGGARGEPGDVACGGVFEGGLPEVARSGVASTWSQVTPCNMHIDKLARQAAKGVALRRWRSR